MIPEANQRLTFNDWAGSWALDARFPFSNDCTHLLGRIEARLNVFQAEPRKHSQQVRGDQDLAGAIASRTNSDSGDLEPGSDLSRCGGRN